MLNDNDLYVIFKLTSGENVMAVLRQEDEENILIEYPMIMRSIINFEEGRESLTAQPLCMFTDEHDFIISKKNITFIKKMHHIFIPHYKKIVDEHEQSTFFIPNEEDNKLSWEDDTPTQKSKLIIKKLKDILESDEESITEKLKRLVPGNDTIN